VEVLTALLIEMQMAISRVEMPMVVYVDSLPEVPVEAPVEVPAEASDLVEYPKLLLMTRTAMLPKVILSLFPSLSEMIISSKY
jgi:hypothetical protein